jgi:hypothetical protein
MRRNWRGAIAKISAACIQLNCPAIALMITSRRATRRTRRSMFSIARLYPTLRTSVKCLCALEICHVGDNHVSPLTLPMVFS